MRIYIIGHDGITLCREAPATVNDGEVAVASKEELYAAPLSGKRLLALWNALPGVEKRRTVGDRKALIDQLWPALEALPDPESEPEAKRPSKQDPQPRSGARVPYLADRYMTRATGRVSKNWRVQRRAQAPAIRPRHFVTGDTSSGRRHHRRRHTPRAGRAECSSGEVVA